MSVYVKSSAFSIGLHKDTQMYLQPVMRIIRSHVQVDIQKKKNYYSRTIRDRLFVLIKRSKNGSKRKKQNLRNS